MELESQVKVEIENDEYQEEKVDLALIGGFVIGSTGYDPFELKIKMESIKKEEMTSCQESNIKDGDIVDMTDNSYNVCSRPSYVILSKCNDTIQSVGKDNRSKTPLNCYTLQQASSQEIPMDSPNAIIKECKNEDTRIENIKLNEQEKSSRTIALDSNDKHRSFVEVNDKYQFQCKECGRSFSYLGSLESHMKIHKGESRFECKECCKSFQHMSHLDRHLRSHAGKFRYKCKKCGKSFLQLLNMRRHEQEHTEL